MNQIMITEQLDALQCKEGVKLLFAVESGSRAWGFESVDSDYDVRFIYLRPKNEYLRLDKQRDVIEWMLNETLDINGWDLCKALTLLHSSNPTLFEWIQSPIVYYKHPFFSQFEILAKECFLSRSCLHHYMNMAISNDREFLQGPQVKLKKYLYVLRPLLACAYVIEHQAPPPMRFEALMQEMLPSALKPTLDALLEQKRSSSEMGTAAAIPQLRDYIDQTKNELEKQIQEMPKQPQVPWEKLNNLFLESFSIWETNI